MAHVKKVVYYIKIAKVTLCSCIVPAQFPYAHYIIYKRQMSSHELNKQVDKHANEQSSSSSAGTGVSSSGGAMGVAATSVYQNKAKNGHHGSNQQFKDILGSQGRVCDDVV